MHRVQQCDINGDDDDVHNARMANGALPRIRKTYKDHTRFLVLFSPKKNDIGQ